MDAIPLKRLEGPARQAFRDSLRAARAAALANAEAAGPLFIAIDQLGKFLNPAGTGLGHHRDALKELARRSVLFDLGPPFHASFNSLFDIVTTTRNAAMHQGVYARHLTRYALELAVVLEDALMADRQSVGDFMIRTPLVAERWHPLSFVRQTMIENSFTFLPVNHDGTWSLVSDYAVAGALRGTGEPLSRSECRERMTWSVEDAIRRGVLERTEPGCHATPGDTVTDVLSRVAHGRMVLVFDSVPSAMQSSVERDVSEQRLIGLLMPFDLL